MKILSLKTNGFRKFPEEFKTDFYDDTTYIFGGNHKGKTNVLFAIVWAFLGSNLTGDERAYLGHYNKDEYYVELIFEDNQDIRHKIIRYKNKLDNGKNFLILDGKLAKQEDLINFYHNKPLFLSIMNLKYFVGLQPAKQKELIDKYLPSVDIKQVYDKLSEEDKKILDFVPVNARLTIKELDDEVKFMQNKITSIHGQINYAKKIATETLQNPEEFSKQQELDFAIQELDALKNSATILDRKELDKRLEELQKEELDLTVEINKLQKEFQEGKNTYQQLLDEKDACCPTCKQKLDIQGKSNATNQYREDLRQQYNKLLQLKEQYKHKHFDKIACKGKILSFENDNKTVDTANIKTLEETINKLELEKQEKLRANHEYSVKLNNKKKAQSDIENFKQEIKLLNSSIEETQMQSNIAKKLYFNSIKEKFEVADKYLKDVKIRFYKIVKATGEIKDDFVITYKDKDFNTLSRSEKIATSLEIANMLNKVSKLNAPLFIDDNETCPDFDFKTIYHDNQLFISQVNKGQALTITNNENLYKKQNIKEQLISVA